jgi:hypothetical protein
MLLQKVMCKQIDVSKIDISRLEILEDIWRSLALLNLL